MSLVMRENKNITFDILFPKKEYINWETKYWSKLKPVRACAYFAGLTADLKFRTT